MPPVLAGTAIVLASGCIEARDTRATARTRSGGDGWERGGTPDRADQPPPRAPQRPAPPDRGTVRGARHETDAADAHDRGAAMKTHQAREPNERKATRRRPPEKCPVRRAKTAGPAALSALLHACGRRTGLHRAPQDVLGRIVGAPRRQRRSRFGAGGLDRVQVLAIHSLGALPVLAPSTVRGVLTHHPLSALMAETGGETALLGGRGHPPAPCRAAVAPSAVARRGSAGDGQSQDAAGRPPSSARRCTDRKRPFLRSHWGAAHAPSAAPRRRRSASPWLRTTRRAPPNRAGETAGLRARSTSPASTDERARQDGGARLRPVRASGRSGPRPAERSAAICAAGPKRTLLTRTGRLAAADRLLRSKPRGPWTCSPDGGPVRLRKSGLGAVLQAVFGGDRGMIDPVRRSLGGADRRGAGAQDGLAFSRQTERRFDVLGGHARRAHPAPSAAGRARVAGAALR